MIDTKRHQLISTHPDRCIAEVAAARIDGGIVKTRMVWKSNWQEVEEADQ